MSSHTAEPSDQVAILLRGAEMVGGPAGPQAVLLAGGRIAAIGPAAETAAPPGARRFDATGLRAAPGFIDLQLNGAAGHDLTADPSAIWAVGAALPASGVTAFLPTIVSAPPGVAEAARSALLAGPPDGYAGATPLGLHVEGPFLSPARHGAHDPAVLREPDPALVADWSPATGIRMVTLAPELPRALEVVRSLVARGVVVSAGHSAATFAEAAAGIEAGIRYVTHLFNAMTPLDHREPGLVGAALADPRVIVGLIPDGIHVHPAVVGLVRRLVGTERFSVVTDAVAAHGLAHGRSTLGTVDVIVDATSARLADGTLAGSILALDQAVRNVLAFSGCTAAEAVASVTRVPARLLGLEAERGTLRPGALADVTLLTSDLGLAATIVAGRLVHDADGRARWV